MYNLDFFERRHPLAIPQAVLAEGLNHAAAQQLISANIVEILAIEGLELLADDGSLSEHSQEVFDCGDSYSGYVLVRYPCVESGEHLMTYLHINGSVQGASLYIEVSPVSVNHTRVISSAAWGAGLNAGGVFVAHAGWMDWQSNHYKASLRVLEHGVGKLLRSNTFNYMYIADREHAFQFFNEDSALASVQRLCTVSAKYEPVETSDLKTYYPDELDGTKVLANYVFLDDGEDSIILGIMASPHQIEDRALRIAVGSCTASFATLMKPTDHFVSGNWLF